MKGSGRPKQLRAPPRGKSLGNTPGGMNVPLPGANTMGYKKGGSVNNKTAPKDKRDSFGMKPKKESAAKVRKANLKGLRKGGKA